MTRSVNSQQNREKKRLPFWPMYFSMIIPMDFPSFLTEAYRAPKSCTAPKKTPPTRSQRRTGTCDGGELMREDGQLRGRNVVLSVLVEVSRCLGLGVDSPGSGKKSAVKQIAAKKCSGSDQQDDKTVHNKNSFLCCKKQGTKIEQKKAFVSAKACKDESLNDASAVPL